MIIVGAGGHAREVYDAECCSFPSARDPVFFAVEDGFPRGPMPAGYNPVVLTFREALEDDQHLLVVAIGDVAARKRIVGLVEERWPRFRNFCVVKHPMAFVAEGVAVGEGSQILYQAGVGSGAKIGRHSIINAGAVLCHDAVLGDFATVGPNATLCGGSRALEGAQVGAGAVVLPGVTVGAWAVLGAGAVATKDIPDREVWAGNPARPLRGDGSFREE